MPESSGKRQIFIDRNGKAAIDLHGFHPHDDGLLETITEGVREAHKRGLPELVFIHGHGHNRLRMFNQFVNSNTGWLGQTVRRQLRNDRELRQWMFAKIDCSHDGSTTVRIRQRAGRRT